MDLTRQLRAFIDDAPVAMAMFDRRMRYLAASRRWVSDYRLEGRGIIGKSHYEVFPEIPERWKAVHRRGLAGEVLSAEAELFKRRDGSAHWLRWEVRPWHERPGVPGGLVIFSEDITERRRAEERFRLVVESAPSAMAMLDLRGTVVLVNRKAERLFGRPRARLLGAALDPLRPAGSPGQKILRRKNGTEVLLQVERTPLQTSEGSFVLLSLSDVTERVRAEKERLRLESIARSEDYGLLEYSLEGVISAWSPGAERIAGYSQDEVLGRRLTMLAPPGREREVEAALRRLGEGKAVPAFETLRRRKDGGQVDLSISCTPLRNPRGAVVGGVSVVRDISERKRAERLREDLIAMGNHELRTPLTVILSSLELLRGEAEGGLSWADARETLEIASRSCRRMIGIVDDFLEAGGLEAGSLPFDIVPLDVEGLVAESLRVHRLYAASRSVVLRRGSKAKGARVRADRERLLQVMTNLLSNAVKHSPARGAVEVSVSRRGRAVRVSVADRGPGIPEEFRPRVFEKFAMGAKPRAGAASSGLGLAIAKLIVERLGGRIWFETKVGRGATFFFELPAAPSRSGAQAQKKDRPARDR